MRGGWTHHVVTPPVFAAVDSHIESTFATGSFPAVEPTLLALQFLSKHLNVKNPPKKIKN